MRHRNKPMKIKNKCLWCLFNVWSGYIIRAYTTELGAKNAVCPLDYVIKKARIR